VGGVVSRKRATPAQVALAWVLAHKPGSSRSRARPSCTGSRRTSPPRNSRDDPAKRGDSRLSPGMVTRGSTVRVHQNVDGAPRRSSQARRWRRPPQRAIGPAELDAAFGALRGAAYARGRDCAARARVRFIDSRDAARASGGRRSQANEHEQDRAERRRDPSARFACGRARRRRAFGSPCPQACRSRKRFSGVSQLEALTSLAGVRVFRSPDCPARWSSASRPRSTASCVCCGPKKPRTVSS
jgi:hypothetical protein